MSTFVDAVRSASRMRRYARLRGEQEDTPETRLVGALFVWGVPALAPIAALLAVATGRESGLLEVGLTLLLACAVAHLLGRPRVQAFDLLHQPSRRGHVMGHVLLRAPRLAWIAATAAGAWLLVAPWLTQRVGGVLMLAAVVLAPLAFALNAGAVRLARRAGDEEAAWLLPLLLPVLGAMLRENLFPEEAWSWGLPVAGLVVGVVLVVRAGALVSALRQVAALLLVVLVAGLPAAPRGPVFADDGPRWLATGAGALLACLVVLATALRTQLRCADVAEVIDTRPTASEDAHASGRRARSGTPLRTAAAGTGLWAARLRHARDAWLPDEEHDGSALGAWAGSSLILLVSVFRGPILAAVAVAYADGGTTVTCLAILAGCLAARVVAVDGTGLEPRLWLLGVDYREQVLHGLRALLVFAAVPTLTVALAALFVAGPGDPGRQAAVMVVAAALLLRAGLPGLWPLQETHRLRLVFVWTGLLALALAYEARWPALDAMHAAGAAGAIGIVLLVVRLARLREPHVADCVRRSEEP